MLVPGARLLSCGTVVFKGSRGLCLRERWSPLLVQALVRGPGSGVLGLGFNVIALKRFSLEYWV